MASAGRLLAALLAVAAPLLVAMGEARCLPWLCRPDPIDKLNDKLLELTDGTDLASNVAAAQYYTRQREFMGHKDALLKLDVRLFSRLNVNEICDHDNFYLVRRLFELASRKNLEDIRRPNAQRRLIRLLHEVRHQFKFTCLARLERAWWDKWGRGEHLETKLAPLINLGPLLEGHAKKTALQKHSEVKQLNGAVQLRKRLRSTRNAADLFTGEELREVLMATKEQQTGVRALKVDEKTGKPLRLDLEDANELLQAYLLEPCRRLMVESTTIDGFLKPILNIASIIRVDDRVKPLELADTHFHAAGWAARYAACDLLLVANYGNQLAAKVAKAR